LYIGGLKSSTFIIHLIGKKHYNSKVIKRNLFFCEGQMDKSTRFIAKKMLIFGMHSQLINMDYKQIYSQEGVYKLIFTHPKTSTWGCVSVNEKQLHFLV
jgi:hypothetical protein